MDMLIFFFIVIIYINEPHCNIMELLGALYCCIILVQFCDSIHGFHHISFNGRTFTLFFWMLNSCSINNEWAIHESAIIVIGHVLEFQNDLKKATVGFLCLPEIVKNIFYPTQFFCTRATMRSPNKIYFLIQ